MEEDQFDEFQQAQYCQAPTTIASASEEIKVDNSNNQIDCTINFYTHQQQRGSYSDNPLQFQQLQTVQRQSSPHRHLENNTQIENAEFLSQPSKRISVEIETQPNKKVTSEELNSKLDCNMLQIQGIRDQKEDDQKQHQYDIFSFDATSNDIQGVPPSNQQPKDNQHQNNLYQQPYQHFGFGLEYELNLGEEKCNDASEQKQDKTDQKIASINQLDLNLLQNYSQTVSFVPTEMLLKKEGYEEESLFGQNSTNDQEKKEEIEEKQKDEINLHQNDQYKISIINLDHQNLHIQPFQPNAYQLQNRFQQNQIPDDAKVFQPSAKYLIQPVQPPKIQDQDDQFGQFEESHHQGDQIQIFDNIKANNYEQERLKNENIEQRERGQAQRNKQYRLKEDQMRMKQEQEKHHLQKEQQLRLNLEELLQNLGDYSFLFQSYFLD